MEWRSDGRMSWHEERANMVDDKPQDQAPAPASQLADDVLIRLWRRPSLCGCPKATSRAKQVGTGPIRATARRARSVGGRTTDDVGPVTSAGYRRMGEEIRYTLKRNSKMSPFCTT